MSENLQSADPLANAPCDDRLTRCRQSFTEAHLERLALAERCGALEQENAVLREFVAARDAVNCHDNETAPWVFEDRMELLEVEADLRVRLAEQFGVRLP